MSRIIFVFMLIAVAYTPAECQVLKTKKDSVSYALGAMIVRTMKQQGIVDVNTDFILQAINDGISGAQVQLYPDEAALCLRNYVNTLNENKNIKLKEGGVKFLEENSKREEVITLASGLQYEVITAGTGPSPDPTDEVLAHYHGTLIDGTVFDSSVERGQPYSLPVNGVIKGWQEALQLMKTGDKWKLFIPYDLGYGANGAGGVIPPFAALIFELELLSIEP